MSKTAELSLETPKAERQLSQAPCKGPKDTKGFPSGREAASGGTRALEHADLGLNLSSVIHLSSNSNNNSSHLQSITVC